MCIYIGYKNGEKVLNEQKQNLQTGQIGLAKSMSKKWLSTAAQIKNSNKITRAV